MLQNNHHGSDLLTKDDFKDIQAQLDSLQDIIFIIVEGFLLFCDEDVCANLDNKFFVIASRETLKVRRESRPGYKTLQGKRIQHVFFFVNPYFWSFIPIYVGYWVDPPGYFDQIVYPQFLLWNSHLLDSDKRDPSIKVLTTDNTSSKEITSTAIHSLVQKYA